MKSTITKALAGAAAAALAAVTLSACGSSDSDADAKSSDTAAACSTMTPVKLQLQWNNQAQFAGYYAAADKGYYKDACLDVTLLEGGSDVVPQKVLSDGGADFAVSWAPKVLGDIEGGLNMVNVAQIFQRSAPLIVSLKEKGITTPADLKGKKWVNWGYGNQWELLAMLQGAGGLAPKDTAYEAEGDTAANLFDDGYDAVTAMTYNELAELLETKNPKTGKLYTEDDFNILDPNKYDASMLEDDIWAMGDKLSDPAFAKTTQAFITASLKGWIYVRDNPTDGAAMAAKYGSQHPATHELWMMNEINKLIWPAPAGIGTVDPAAWKRTVDESMKVIDPASGKPLITKATPDSVINQTFVTKALSDLKAEGLDVTGESFTPEDVTLTEGGE
ncbi:ABC transporter substrate-binding protein [Nocardioides sp. Kera G14]|uniref:ABC transporter substrate-binding protein n=1 Tax=Nocardioides sp. Kera G14 TaxID=2884264 RepID=UPI001D104304|nr:ABC transporter substrate-binding protein [Nocardioides sp. Kera G14]UDY24306.1 ABC transporter substrate-binding protein [Nocardioides sp. Kera G14]